MRAVLRWRICLSALLIVGTVLAAVVTRGAAGLGEFVQHLDAMEPRVKQAATDPRLAGQVITELDSDEGTFAHFTTVAGASRAELLDAYHMLDRMLGQMYDTYRKKHDDCLNNLGNGNNCDYDLLEQLELRALYPLSWLRFHGSILFTDPGVRRRTLKQAIAGFTQSALVIVSPELIRENLLGRAYCERDLGQFDRSHYAKAIADFKETMKAGPGSAQYRAAQQGLATTYAAMGQVDKAAAITARLSQSTTGAERQGAEMFRLQELFRAEAEATDQAMRADYHRQAVGLLRGYYGNSKQWPLALAAVNRDVSNPEAEFGASKDPFEQYLLAELFLSTHHPLPAAKYYLAAARSGQYPQGYKYSIDIYFAQGRLDLIDAPLEELAHQRHSPMADWAAYMQFKIARMRWERGGMKDPALKNRWIARARDYVDRYPRGRYAYEPRFRLADLLQEDGKYSEAAAQFEQVKGDPFYAFAARFKAAECRFQELASAAGKAGGKSAMPAARKNALTAAVIAGFRSTVAEEPALEKRLAAERQFLHSARGRAAYLLVTLLEAQPHRDNAEIVRLLNGFETAYPRMNVNFDELMRWRLQALDSLGQYAQAEIEIGKLLNPGRRPQPSSDFIKTIGLDLWKQGKAKKARGEAGWLAEARLTAQIYAYFEKQVLAGTMNPKSLTGTLSILGQAYVAMNDSERARSIFEQVVKASPASPDANAGLARLAQTDKDYRDAADLWTRVESNAAESDDLWYEARYNLAVIYAADGNLRAACGKLAQTRSEHPSLGGREMKARWDGLQRKLCLRGGVVL